MDINIIGVTNYEIAKYGFIDRFKGTPDIS